MPDLHDLDGTLDGVVLNGSLSLPGVRSLRLWRGKVFHTSTTGSVRGKNRLGIGPAEAHAFTFEARIAPSRFAERDVLLLDHENDSNPLAVQLFHDELVQVDDGLYLATSHYRSRRGPEAHARLLCYFALARRN